MHHVAALLGVGARLDDGGVGLLGAVGGALDRGGQLVEGRGGLGQCGRLLLGAARQVVGRVADLAGAGGHLFGVGRDQAHLVAQAHHYGVEVVADAGVGRGQVDVDLVGQVPVRQPGQAVGEGVDHPGAFGLQRLAGLLGLAVRGFRGGDIGRDGEVHVHQRRLDQAVEGVVEIPVRPGLAEHAALAAALAHRRADNLAERQGVGADGPARRDAVAGVGLAGLARRAGVVFAEAGGGDGVPVGALAATGRLDLAVVLEDRPRHHAALELVGVEIERLGQFTIDERPQRPQGPAGLRIQLDEVHAPGDFGVRHMLCFLTSPRRGPPR